MHPIDEILLQGGYTFVPDKWDNRYVCLSQDGKDDGMSTDYDSLKLLYDIVLGAKPNVVVETGTWHGVGSIVIAAALAKNDCGFLHTIEKYAHPRTKAHQLWNKFPTINARILSYAGDSTKPWLGDLEIDIAFIDCFHRYKAMKALEDRYKENALIMVHDWNTREGVPSQFKPDLDYRGPVVVPNARSIGMFNYVPQLLPLR